MALTLDGTKGETFPSWTTATRPASPAAGQTGFNTTTGQIETYNGTAWAINSAATSQGTSGQYLQSAGAGASPTWATLSSSGALIRAPQILTSGTSYTTPSNCTAIYVEMVGGGGGGGGIQSGGASSPASGGGGSGAYVAKYFTVTGSTAYTYAIGAAGTAGTTAPTNGGTGGNTTFTVGATTITAGGGSGGTAVNGTTSRGGGGAGGTGTNGDLNSTGTRGMPGILTGGLGGPGGNSYFGGAGDGQQTSATGYGSGGSGVGASSSQAGGAGSQGIIRIWEYT